MTMSIDDPNVFRPAHESQAESRAMTRSEAAAARRNFEQMNGTLITIQRHLLNLPVTETNVNEVAEQLLAASRLRESLNVAKPLLTAALPQNSGGKLSEHERKEIRGYYQTGHFTQNALAQQYQVSQATIHNIVTDSLEKE